MTKKKISYYIEEVLKYYVGQLDDVFIKLKVRNLLKKYCNLKDCEIIFDNSNCDDIKIKVRTKDFIIKKWLKNKQNLPYNFSICDYD